MYQPKIITPYALHFVLAVLITLLLCNCRTTSQRSDMRVVKQKDSTTVKLSEKAQGSISSQVQSHTDITGNHWKVTYHFDTSKPTNPATGLPPTSRVELEGSEIQKKVDEKENVSVETSDSTTYQKTQTNHTTDITQHNLDQQKETGGKIEKAVAAGFILLFITICIIAYVRQNTPKQNH